MRALVVLLALLLPWPAAAETLLRLAETAHVAVQPDELVAVLRSEASEVTAAQAQARVNARIGKALDASRAVHGITASTGIYSVYQRPPAKLWTAVQSIELRSGDGAALLALVGSLQSDDLALGQLGWQVAPATLRARQAEAQRQALAALRGRAEEAAKILGLRFDSFREVRLGGEAQAMPMPRLAMAMSASAVAPRAEAEASDVTATVEADAVLLPP